MVFFALFSKKRATFDAYGTLMVPPEGQKGTISLKRAILFEKRATWDSEVPLFSNKIALFYAYDTLMVPNEVSFG